jgi:hypothetical protein
VKTYPTFDAAQRRVEVLKRRGVWPGIVGPLPEGTYQLMYDPTDAEDDR